MLSVICRHQCPNDSHKVSILHCLINLHREENSNTALKRFWRDFSELVVSKCGSHRSSQHWLTGLYLLFSAITFLSFFVRSRQFDFFLCYFFNFDSIEVRVVVETRVFAVLFKDASDIFCKVKSCGCRYLLCLWRKNEKAASIAGILREIPPIAHCRICNGFLAFWLAVWHGIKHLKLSSLHIFRYSEPGTISCENRGTPWVKYKKNAER